MQRLHPCSERSPALAPRAAGARGRRAVGVALVLAWLFAVAVGADSARAGTVPAGFTDSVAISGLVNPTAVRFARDGRVFVAEKSGLIKVFDGASDPTPTVFADLRTNVHNFWDRGLLGLALDPAFPAKPYVYVLYTYDHVLGTPAPAPRWGTPGASSDSCPSPPGPTADGCVVSGRLSRLQASGNVMTGPEHVLIEGWCQQYPSHSVGSLAFGPDGALYVSGGEGASFDFADYGQKGNPANPCGDPPGGAGATPAPPTAEGGALRAQDLRTAGDPVGLSGAVLRVDPDTGAGLPDNPLAASPDANARRIVAYGFRNPFRIALRPGTSDVWVGDVGLATFEEIDHIPNPSGGVLNFGWPCYEGAGRLADYDTANLAICENLYAQPGAVTAPVFTYAQPAKVVPGDPCPVGSSSVSGLAFSVHGPYPAAYDGALFFADYSRRCIWVMKRGAGGLPSPTAVSTFVAAAANPVDLQIAPSGELYYVDLDGGTIHRVRFVATSPPPPAPKPTPVIVGLGDSYSSGEANPRYDAGTDLRADRCHRSFLSWQRLVGVSSADQFACSGARLRDLTSGQHAVAPDNVGQLARLRLRATSKHIDWVALTIGGNDLGFARILRDCLDPRTTCLPQSEQLQRRQLDALEPFLVSAYRSAAIAGGGARVAVVGYPYLFPNVRSRYTGCAGMSHVEKVRIRRAQDLVEATLKRAAAEAGATFVSTLGALRGRELCTTRSWMFPIHVAAGGKADDQQQAHPTACGQAAIARKVVAALHLRRAVYGCDSSKELHVVILGDTRPEGRSADLRAVVSSSLHRRLRNIDVALTTILNPTPRSVTNVRVYDPRHFSADVDQSGSAAVGADRVWYAPAGASIRKVASCSFRHGCRAPARSVPTRLATVRLLGARGAPRIRPRRFVREQTSGTDLEFLAVRWAHWGARKAIGSGRMAGCRRPPCAGRHAAVSLTAASLILCPVAGQARTVGYYHSLRYRRRRDGLTKTFTVPSTTTCSAPAGR